ncbi:MAG: DUF2283 domain-containing protein [Anaerolineae bacterium]|nr:DUF2283 domain-containing protein [Anaerolineae bacterium]
MKVTYYAQSDILYLEFSEAEIGSSQNVGQWANVTFAPDGTPRSLEILNAAARRLMCNRYRTPRSQRGVKHGQRALAVRWSRNRSNLYPGRGT